MAHPFKIKFDERFDPDGLNIRANLNEMLTSEEQRVFLESIIAWSEKLSETIYLDEEIEWYEGSEGTWAEVYIDLHPLEEEAYESLELLWERFDAFPKITSVMVGSGYESWPVPPDED